MDLRLQQFKVLKENTDLSVDFYHGTKVGTMNGKKVDEWDAAVWEHETDKNQVSLFLSFSFHLLKLFF